MKNVIQNILKSCGLQIKRYPSSDLKRRIKIMEQCQIDTLFDVGANTGQFGKQIRELGYAGKIVSFEPLKSAFKALEKIAQKDKSWIVNNYALGNEDMSSTINIADNSYSSSILEIVPEQIQSTHEFKYIDEQKIEIKKLDTIFEDFTEGNARIMLKIDTQGYEKNVLEGALKILNSILIIQLEMSLVPLYKDEILFNEMKEYLEGKNFILFSLENGFENENTGQLLQLDGIFVNQTLLNQPLK